MLDRRIASLVFIFSLGAIGLLPGLAAGSSGGAGTVAGTVKDQSGAVIPGATVTIRNPVSGYERTASTDASGTFTFTNIPYNPYHLSVTETGFTPRSQDVGLSSTVPVTLNITMELAGAKTTVTVSSEASDLIEVDPTSHTDVDRSLIDKLPLESQSSGLSSLVTLSTRESLPIRMGSFMVSEIMRRIPFPSTTSPSPTNRAKSFPINFRKMPCNRWRSSTVLHRRSLGVRPV